MVYQIPTFEKETNSGFKTVSLISQNYSNRKIFLFGPINEETVYSFTMQMMTLMEDEKAPIDIYLNSPGGEVVSGLAIYDIIKSCKTPINIYCIGMAASMAAVLLSSAKKGHRYILPHSKVMIHEPLIPQGVGGSATSLKNTADSILQTRDLLNNILASNTGKTIEEINKATDHDNYMDAKEAIEFGICDKIIKKL